MSSWRAALPALALLALVPAPARAATGDVMVCSLTYSNYGLGPEPGWGDCTAVAGPYTGASLDLEFMHDIAPAACPVAETASGTLTGPGGLVRPFVWTKVLSGGVMTYQTGTTGTTGPGAWVVTSPLGNACGAAVVTMTAVLPLP